MDGAALALIVRRELMTNLRSLKSAGLMLVFMVLMTSMASISMVEASNFSATSAPMRNFFTLQALALFFVAMGVVPGMAAVSLSSERESGGYDLLAISLIPSWAVILGKYLAVLIYFFLFCVAVLPFMGLVFFYAGVDILHFFDTFVWTLPPVPFNAALGIWISGMERRSARAVLAVYGMMVAVVAFFFGAISMVASLASVSQYVTSLKPLWTALSTWSWNIPILFGSYLGVLTMLFLADAMSQYRISGVLVRPRAIGRGATKPTRERRLVRWYREARSQIPQLTVPDGVNPYGYRELYGTLLAGRSTRAALTILLTPLYVSALAYLVLIEGDFGLFVALERMAFVLLVPPLLAIALVKEREETTLDMNRMTARPGAHMLLGKMVGLIRLYRPVVWAIVLGKLTVAVVATGYGLYFFWTAGVHYAEVHIFRHWYDLASLPLHVMLVLCLACVGAVFPRSTVGAIVGALACSGAFLVPTMLFQVQWVKNMVIPPELKVAYLMVFLLPTIATLIPCWFTFTIAAARITVLWEPKN